MKNYIFGYGSLIEKASRMRTTPNAKHVYPVVLSGYKRGWFARIGVPSLSTTFLGCQLSNEQVDTVNGVIYEVSEADLALTDLREDGYRRSEIDIKQVKNLSELDLSDCRVFIYLSDFQSSELDKRLPSPQFPIVQSYVDICINGCLEIEAAFAKAKEYGFAAKFISETQGWNEYWVNDRIYPRRPFIHCPNAYLIDRLLQDHLPSPALFKQIYFE